MNALFSILIGSMPERQWFRWTAMVAALIVALCLGKPTVAQTLMPDPGGWGNPALVLPAPDASDQSDDAAPWRTLPASAQHPSTENTKPFKTAAPLRPLANQPASIEFASKFPSAQTRSMIGLASFETPAAEPTPESAVVPSQQTDQTSTLPTGQNFQQLLSGQGESLVSRDSLESTVKAALLLAALSLAPAIVLMTTSYVRVVIVLSLLRQAFGSQNLPPTQVITALSLFVTMLVMTPVWNEVKRDAIDPYTTSGSEISWDQAWERGVVPVRNFMTRQIKLTGNTDSIAVFYRYLPEQPDTPPTSYDDVPLNVLLPAYMVSELKVAFLLGFQIFLPFLVLDLIVSSVTVSMGMLMLPPNMVSFPLKLILFVMVDGWNLVIGLLLQSFG